MGSDLKVRNGMRNGPIGGMPTIKHLVHFIRQSKDSEMFKSFTQLHTSYLCTKGHKGNLEAWWSQHKNDPFVSGCPKVEELGKHFQQQ